MGSRSRDMAGARMEPEPFDFRPQLDDEQWALIANLSSPSLLPSSTSNSGCSAAASLSSTVDYGAHDQLAAVVPATGDSLRILLIPFSQLRQARLYDDRLEAVLKPALVHLATLFASVDNKCLAAAATSTAGGWLTVQRGLDSSLLNTGEYSRWAE